MEKRPILILGALKNEINLLKDVLQNKRDCKIGIYNCFEGEINDYPVIIVKTEVGIGNSAAATALAIEKYRPILIINEGTAGGITKKHHKKDIVIVKECFNINSYKSPYKELGDGSDSRMWELMSFTDGQEDTLKRFYSNEFLVKFIDKMKNEYKEGNVFKGIVGSGDAWNREKDKLNYLDEKYNIACEDMEASSIYFMAKEYDIPIVSIKIMSDNELLGEDYEPNVARYCQEFVKKVVYELTKSEQFVEKL